MLRKRSGYQGYSPDDERGAQIRSEEIQIAKPRSRMSDATARPGKRPSIFTNRSGGEAATGHARQSVVAIPTP
jgi:hypothetical protein